MLRVYECLPAALQERWAAACNADFRSCLGQSLALEAAEPLAQLIFGSQGGTEEAEKARAKLSEIFSGLLGDSGHAEITVKVVKVDPPPRKENPDGG